MSEVNALYRVPFYYSSVCERRLAGVQEVLVEFNVVKLEVDYVRNCVYKTEGHLVSLERQRLELESAIKDRLELVAGRRRRLTTLRRNVESERMRLSMELKDRLAQLDRIRNR